MRPNIPSDARPGLCGGGMALLPLSGNSSEPWASRPCRFRTASLLEQPHLRRIGPTAHQVPQELPAVRQTPAKPDDRLAVFVGSVPLVLGEPVAGILRIQSLHDPV